jgi:hypothetical protein
MRTRNFGRTAAAALCFGLILALAGTVFGADRKVGDKTFASAATHAAGTAYSTGMLVENYTEGLILVSVSGVSGVPSFSLVAETSEDNSTYYHHSTIASGINATGATAYQITNFGKYLRMKQVVSGPDGNETITYEIEGVFKN